MKSIAAGPLSSPGGAALRFASANDSLESFAGGQLTSLKGFLLQWSMLLLHRTGVPQKNEVVVV